MANLDASIRLQQLSHRELPLRPRHWPSGWPQSALLSAPHINGTQGIIPDDDASQQYRHIGDQHSLIPRQSTMPSFQTARATGPSRQEIISRGKQVAKAALSIPPVPMGLDGNPSESLPPVAQILPANPNTEGITPKFDSILDVPTISRKRSRSGSLIQHATTSSLPPVARTPGPPSEHLSRDQRLLRQYVERESLQLAAFIDQQRAQTELIHKKELEATHFRRVHETQRKHPALVFGAGYSGFGNGNTEVARPQILYPNQRPRPGGRYAPELRLSRRQLKAQAACQEELVPIRLEIDHEKIKLRDTFTWNLSDQCVTPELFAQHLVEDYGLRDFNPEPIQAAIALQIKSQLQEHYPHVYVREEAIDPHLPYFAYKNDEMRCLIKLNITVGSDTLADQFEWDINEPQNSPEVFAKQMANDLKISGEFTTAIAHAIREQTQAFTKSLYITNHPFDGRPIEDGEIQEAMLPSPLPSTFRPYQSAKEFSPYFFTMGEADLDRAEEIASREQRRQKRAGRRGGPALPDLKEKQRTVRTQFVSLILPGAVSTFEESKIIRKPKSSGPRTSGRGRRKGGDDSDDSESDESMEESLPPSTPGLYRGVPRRGAASAANAAMRAIGRSATPDSMLLSPRDYPTSGKRVSGRQQSLDEEPPHLVVVLRPSKDKYRNWLMMMRARQLGYMQQQQRQMQAAQQHQQQQQNQLQDQAGLPPHLMQQQEADQLRLGRY